MFSRNVYGARQHFPAHFFDISTSQHVQISNFQIPNLQISKFQMFKFSKFQKFQFSNFKFPNVLSISHFQGSHVQIFTIPNSKMLTSLVHRLSQIFKNDSHIYKHIIFQKRPQFVLIVVEAFWYNKIHK